MNVARLRTALMRPVAPESLAVFRILFGLLVLVLVGRYYYYDWVAKYFIEPEFFFRYYGFGWIRVPDEPWIHGLLGLIGLSSLGIVLGYRARWAAGLFFVSFTYMFLMDVTVYLNHYYLLCLLGLLLCFLPTSADWSLDRWAGRSVGPVRLLHIQILRLQLGLVYFFGGLAKLNSDWLFSALPMKLWLRVRTDFPGIGPLFALEETAYLFSWAGLVFDLSVFFFLMRPATRRFAFAALVCFHCMTALLFEIGMFSWIMIACATIFFEPDWPLRLLRRLRPSFHSATIESARIDRLNVRQKIAGLALVVYFTVQFLFPLRHHLYGPDLSWREEGFRFAWQVMVMQKSGYIEFEITEPATRRVWRENPADTLSSLQKVMLGTQPDLILQFAHWLGARYRRAGREVEVRALSRVSLNGRPGVALVDPEVDLLRIDPGWARKSFIQPAPR